MNNDKTKPRDPFLQFKDEVYAQYAQRYPEIKGVQLVSLLAQDFRKLPIDVVEKYEKKYQQQLAEVEAQKNPIYPHKITFKKNKSDGTTNGLYQINIDCEYQITEINLKVKKEGEIEEVPVNIKLDYDEG